jgi:hypothetical protein
MLAGIHIAQLGPVLRFLREVGEVPAADGADVRPVEALLAEFRRRLAEERSLSAVTVRCYSKQAGVFLAGVPEPLDVALRGLDAGQFTSFMLGYCPGRNTESAKSTVTAVRGVVTGRSTSSCWSCGAKRRCWAVRWPGRSWSAQIESCWSLMSRLLPRARWRAHFFVTPGPLLRRAIFGHAHECDRLAWRIGF